MTVTLETKGSASHHRPARSSSAHLVTDPLARAPRFPTLHLLGALLRDAFVLNWMPRTPEPTLMTEEEQVAAYTDACRHVPAMRATHLYLATQAARALPDKGRVVDLGCGSGQFLCELAALRPDLSFLGVDLSESMLTLAAQTVRERGLTNVTFRREDITALTLPDHFADAVTSTVALHHLPALSDLDACFRGIGRILRPGGALFLSDFARPRREETVQAIAAMNAGASDIFRRDTVYSVRAAFRAEEFLSLARRHWAGRHAVEYHAMPFRFGIQILQTPTRRFSEDLLRKIQGLERNAGAAVLRQWSGLRQLYRLGRLVNGRRDRL